MRKEDLFTKKKIKSLVAVALVAAMAVPATVNLNKVSADDETGKVTYDAAISTFNFTSEEEEEEKFALNEDMAGNEIIEDEFGNSAVRLGEIIEDGGTGVSLGKIYGGKKELKETLSDALKKTGITFAGYTKVWKDGETEYYRVNNFSSREKAVANYLEQAEPKQKEYERKQVWAYAENNTAKGVVLSGKGTADDPYVAVATDASVKISEIILVYAQVEKQSTSSTYANANNLKKAYVNAGTITTDEIISWSNGLIKSADDCIKANSLGQTFAELYPEYAENPENTTPETYTFPYPTWEKGVTVSTWVKVPAEGRTVTEEAVITSGEGAEATEVSVEVEKQLTSTVFEFAKGEASLYFKTDGTLKFLASSDTSSNAGRNVYEATYTGNTPEDNAGKWVYVTLAIKNDGVDVYYNGEKANVKYKNGAGDTACSYFNYGTGYAMEDTEARIAACVDGNNYLDILKNFGLSTDYSDFTKYNFRTTTDSGVENIMDFLTLSKTEFLLGGDDESTGAYFDETCEGMEFGTTSFYDYVMTAEQAKAAFEDVAESHGISIEIPATPTPTGEAVSPTPTGEAVSPTPTGEAVSPTPSQTPEVEKKVGDANEDGEVNLADVLVVLRAALGIEELEKGSQAFINANVNGDETIGLDDCLEVLKIAVGINS